MAHIVAVSAAAGAWALTAYGFDLLKKSRMPKDSPKMNPPPLQGMYTAQRQWTNCDTRGIFASVEEDVDVNGARIFLVDHGTGSRTVNYTDPRILY